MSTRRVRTHVIAASLLVPLASGAAGNAHAGSLQGKAAKAEYEIVLRANPALATFRTRAMVGKMTRALGLSAVFGSPAPIASTVLGHPLAAENLAASALFGGTMALSLAVPMVHQGLRQARTETVAHGLSIGAITRQQAQRWTDAKLIDEPKQLADEGRVGQRAR